jgi:pSer/pThr/pTyr-binding forkhead associated (FHA) protein
MLLIKSPEFEGKAFKLEGQKLTLGRSEEHRICLPHPSVSSNHAELRLEGGDYRLVDLNSTNGTRVNDERITETLLRNHDVVMFGNILATYESENVVAAPPMPQSSSRVDIQMGAGSGRPSIFRNLAPFPKPAKGREKIPNEILLTALLALGGLGFYLYKIVTVMAP